MVKTMKPLVSIVLPTFNAESTIERAVHSILCQDFKNYEIVIVDDGSTDNTVQKVLDIRDRHRNVEITLLRFDENYGASFARNKGIEIAKGKYIAFQDADDEWLPTKLTKQLSLFEKRDDLSIVTCDSIIIYDKPKVVEIAHESRPPVEGENAWKTLLLYNFIPTPTVVAKKVDIERVGGFDEKLEVAEDLDLWIKLALQGSVGVVYEPLVKIYDIQNSLMRRAIYESHSKILSMIKCHIEKNRKHLSKNEIRRILGRKYFAVGMDLYGAGYYNISIRLLIKSFIKGERPIICCLVLLRALKNIVASYAFKRAKSVFHLVHHIRIYNESKS